MLEISVTIVLILMACSVLCVIHWKDLHQQWNTITEESWPAISDEEFLAKCPPGTDPEIALGVRRIVSDQLCIPYDRIHPEHSFVDDLGAD